MFKQLLKNNNNTGWLVAMLLAVVVLFLFLTIINHKEENSSLFELPGYPGSWLVCLDNNLWMYTVYEEFSLQILEPKVACESNMSINNINKEDIHEQSIYLNNRWTTTSR